MIADEPRLLSEEETTTVSGGVRPGSTSPLPSPTGPTNPFPSGGAPGSEEP